MSTATARPGLVNGADPDPPSITDVAQYGPEACLLALREVFSTYHARWPQYRGWTQETVLGVVMENVNREGRSFDRALIGDLVLVRLNLPYMTPGHYSVYCPRVGWNCSLPYGTVEIVRVAWSAP